jgi:hypothetical protein
MARSKWAGALWYIGTKTTALENESAWVAIEGARVASGSFGKEWRTTDATVFADEFVRNAKTLFDTGQLDLTFLRNKTDSGQAALSDACDDSTDDPYNFRVVLKDGNAFRFKAQVLSFMGVGAGPTAIVEHRARLDIEDEVIEEA